uniref:TrmE-type G domain-containing protein n=1 Tax=Chromera velia CCMP2878 TaxID=1169474 RepID=A0A0G4HJF2_9ALVE|eukprot:Cvel_7066.t1-p1 / transcript=Cvel_7066.t1 / gene=Cvel_7066 / organism=Chromera_velia_CCMP2878 / gene_product=tRNA modification GTPase MnmE, putative / transcript_product=tRNA modification GTPase MnmE, putative / location=Cvel_scaffold361:55839-62205(+) / protein_length=671 / sequence_SO=supercontig / SO=protein_coding / is_pseudo=false
MLRLLFLLHVLSRPPIPLSLPLEVLPCRRKELAFLGSVSREAEGMTRMCRPVRRDQNERVGGVSRVKRRRRRPSLSAPLSTETGTEDSPPSSPSLEDPTIYALSSGPAVKSGVAVTRISGPRAFLVRQLLVGAQSVRESLLGSVAVPSGAGQTVSSQAPHSGLVHSPSPSPLLKLTEDAQTNAETETLKETVDRRAQLRRLYDPLTGEEIDHCLVLFFRGPRSFTGEDVLELHTHGSRGVVQGLFGALRGIDEILQTQGEGGGGRLRPAERGEFTRRAFENGKMRLTEVEGLADLLDSQTAEQRRQALRQMDGVFARRVDEWRSRVVSGLAALEAVVDFGDDDTVDLQGDETLKRVRKNLGSLLRELQRFLEDRRAGEIVRQGLRVCLVGPPNAGKSSLLNRLAQREAAIVSPIAGTTRDVLEVQLDVAGFAAVVSDTAGLRERGGGSEKEGTEEVGIIEQEGMRRAREVASRADVLVLVLDSSSPSLAWGGNQTELSEGDQGLSVREADDLFASNLGAERLVVLNKRDLLGGSRKREEDVQAVAADLMSRDQTERRETRAEDEGVVWSNCLNDEGVSGFVEMLEKKIRRRLQRQKEGDEGGTLITRERHRVCLTECAGALEAFLDALESGGLDIAAEELRYAARVLGSLGGEIDSEEILDIVFRDFCIGK